MRRGGNGTLLNDRSHFHEPAVRHAQCFGGSEGQVEDAAFGEGPSVIDDDHNATLRSWVRHAETRTERKAAVCGSKFFRIVAFAIGGPTRVIIAVVSGDAGKIPGALGDSATRRKAGDQRQACRCPVVEGHLPIHPRAVKSVWYGEVLSKK